MARTAKGVTLRDEGSSVGDFNILNFIGSGVSVANAGNGVASITISSGGGSLAVLAATGTVDDSNLTFTFASTPTVVVVNGAVYADGYGVTIIGLSAVINNPVGTGGFIYGL